MVRAMGAHFIHPDVLRRIAGEWGIKNANQLAGKIGVSQPICNDVWNGRLINLKFDTMTRFVEGLKTNIETLVAYSPKRKYGDNFYGEGAAARAGRVGAE